MLLKETLPLLIYEWKRAKEIDKEIRWTLKVMSPPIEQSQTIRYDLRVNNLNRSYIPGGDSTLIEFIYERILKDLIWKFTVLLMH